MFAADVADESVLVRMFTDYMNPFPMIICVVALAAVVFLAHVAREMIRDRRQQMLRHEERMAIIDAGLHPDFPPEAPAAGETGGMEQTLDYQEQV